VYTDFLCVCYKIMTDCLLEQNGTTHDQKYAHCWLMSVSVAVLSKMMMIDDDVNVIMCA